jgi:exosortase J
LVWVSLGAAVAIGAAGLLPVFTGLWEIWTTDALRSIGMLIVPIALLLIAREWHMSGWELEGTWWGLLPLLLSYFVALKPLNLLLSGRSTPLAVNLLPQPLPLFLFGCGIILLFAGPRVCKRVWFPLVLLLLAQPVPNAFVHLLDYPLQSFSARTARAFAALIGFSPQNPDTLKLMFSPTFGMFIAPGCDGLRGAVGLGYAALIVGYLKRVSIKRWLLYVASGIFMGHLFNLVRLCALVLYYRVALGHPTLERVARQADYVIGGILFSIATVLFLAVVFRSNDFKAGRSREKATDERLPTNVSRALVMRIALVSILGLLTSVPAISALRVDRHSVLALLRSGRLHPQDLDNMLPKEFGEFRLVRAWREELNGAVVMESGIYRSSDSDEVTLGIWLGHSNHSAHDSWMVHGESPEFRTVRNYATSQGRTVSFDTAFYTDGISDRFAGAADCTPMGCRLNLAYINDLSLVLSQGSDVSTNDSRAVPFFFSIERVHQNAAGDLTANQLSEEARRFLSEVDFPSLSRQFQ